MAQGVWEMPHLSLSLSLSASFEYLGGCFVYEIVFSKVG